jgi:hypothetical protein
MKESDYRGSIKIRKTFLTLEGQHMVRVRVEEVGLGF